MACISSVGTTMSIPSAMSTSWLASDALIAAVEHHQDSSMVIISRSRTGSRACDPSGRGQSTTSNTYMCYALASARRAHGIRRAAPPNSAQRRASAACVRRSRLRCAARTAVLAARGTATHIYVLLLYYMVRMPLPLLYEALPCPVLLMLLMMSML